MAKTEPNKAQVIQQLRLDTGLSLSEGKDVIDEIFARGERGEVEKQLVEPMVTIWKIISLLMVTSFMDSLSRLRRLIYGKMRIIKVTVLEIAVAIDAPATPRFRLKMKMGSRKQLSMLPKPIPIMDRVALPSARRHWFMTKLDVISGATNSTYLA